MFPGDLTQLFPIIMLALAVGCGAPALIYLAFKGTLRKEEPEAKPPEHPQLGDLTGLTPVFVKGYVFVPKEFLENALKQSPSTMQKPSPKEESPGKE
ncbi:MAG: hypothetical protein ACPLZY_03485, partial [Candidatus Norongarragalinales archaeon]